jgi:hypothetical protein
MIGARSLIRDEIPPTRRDFTLDSADNAQKQTIPARWGRDRYDEHLL